MGSHLWKYLSIKLLVLALFQPFNVVAELESRAQLQSHVFHYHIAPQQHQSLPIDFMFSEELRMWSQSLGVCVSHKLHHLVYRPDRGVLVGHSGGLSVSQLKIRTCRGTSSFHSPLHAADVDLMTVGAAPRRIRGDPAEGRGGGGAGGGAHRQMRAAVAG